MKKFIVGAALVALTGVAYAQAARDYISVVGSSTVYPFSTVVAESFGRKTSFKTPKIESTGSGGGLKLFCSGVGVGHPDITNSSRRIKQSEVDLCASNGVTDIVEVKIGYDGIVLATAKTGTKYSLTRRDIFLALAKNVPVDGELVPNPYTKWSDVNAELPPIKIEVIGPPPTSGTRDAFAELAMEGGCKTFDWIKELKNTDKGQYKTICHTVREDGAYIEAGENDNLIIQKLTANPTAVGVFGFSFLDQNNDLLYGANVDGVDPEFETIADGSYPISRPLYFYVKTAHVDIIPGMREFVEEFTAEGTWGDEGYLSDRGLIPLPEGEREAVAEQAKNLETLSLTE